MNQRPSAAYVSSSWAALAIGFFGYLIGLWRANMVLHEKGYYFTLLMFGLFAVVSLQKSVRDKLEGIKVTEIYHNICWFGVFISMTLLVVGLWNASLLPSEKGFYAFGFLLAMFGAVSIQKNTRDIQIIEQHSENSAAL